MDFHGIKEVEHLATFVLLPLAARLRLETLREKISSNRCVVIDVQPAAAAQIHCNTEDSSGANGANIVDEAGVTFDMYSLLYSARKRYQCCITIVLHSS